MENSKIIEMEVSGLIQSTMLMLKETKRLEEQYCKDDFGRGRYEGIVIANMDMLENFIRFANRIGIKLNGDGTIAN